MTEYSTNDIVLSSALKVCGYKMKEITVIGSRGTFHFENVDKEFLTDYNMDKILVQPVAFHDALKQLTTSVRRLTQIR